ncbi:LysR family transcriptional regulator [Rhizobium sp. ERR 922]|uniref:LysR family transcriptional regulator n=1 Tax=unclassified Rhizobium TaxID=2613769 RepID=UPI0011ACA68B|nr:MULTISPECIES: LysR family transcriptional regulator [unclassified Rhizobium]TWB46190.1 LysR family transcriptional regulator [Rhizobium sp. ERR 922]TWB90772.1 LysR family transcriptional regulator [Rhizobium sp. ERR 942]
MVSCDISKNMSDNFLDMLVFVRVVQARSLSGAARELNFSLTVISRKLSRLEERLGVRLINRTTRSLALTDEGARFYDRCVQILAEIDDAETEASSGRDTAIGTLKVTSTFAFGIRWIAPLLSEFQEMHPGLLVHLDTDDTLTNIVEGGYDLAIRFGALADSSLVARQIAPNRRVICAAPAYLDRRGRPETIEDLTRHEVIAFGEPPNNHWTFADGRSANVMGRLTTNNGELAHRWALSGAGLVLKSIWDVQDDIESGKLEIVLPDVHLAAAPIHVVFPHSRLAAAKVRLCIEFLANRLKSSNASLRF